MSTDIGTPRPVGVTVAGLRFAVFTTRNAVMWIAILAMNYTLMRPSPVDLLFVLSFLITLFHMTLYQRFEVTNRVIILTLLIGAWTVSFFVASMPFFNEQFVGFELLSKTFAISIGITCAFVSMTWGRKQFETFMCFYIVSCVIGAILGTIGFVLQMELLTWDGRAKGLIDDPNMYGTFLIPAVVFCAYFLSRGQGSRLFLLGAMAAVFLAILLCFSRIAVVAAVLCLFAYIFFHNRANKRRLVQIVVGIVVIGVVLFLGASLTSPEFSAKLLDRLTFAKDYDLGEEGRYNRYLLVLPMIAHNPLGLGVLQLNKIFPEPIHNIWLSSFVNYGWAAGVAWIALFVSSVVVSIRNYRRTRNEIPIALLISLVGVVMGASLHEGEHWRQMWVMYGLIWGLNVANFQAATPVANPPAPKPRTVAPR